jgi:hypothetical protein
MIRSESSEPRAPLEPFVSLVRVKRARFVGALLATSLVVSSLGLSPRALADGPSVPDPAAAALFSAGRDLVDKGNWKDGCAKFEASMILFPAASTLLNIARCYEHEGKLALAWSAYQRALVINRETQGEERKKALEEVARKGLAKVEPRLPRIKIVMRGASPSGMRITHNGKDVPQAMLGTVLPVDPGPQSVNAEAPGYAPFSRTVDVQEGKLVDVTIDFKPEGRAPSGGKRIPVWAWAAGGGGVALLAASAVFRVDQAFVEGKQAGYCGDDLKRCPPVSVYRPDDDNARKNRDNALFLALGGVGVAALSVGIVGIALAPSGSKSDTSAYVVPLLGPGAAGAQIGGRF